MLHITDLEQSPLHHLSKINLSHWIRTSRQLSEACRWNFKMKNEFMVEKSLNRMMLLQKYNDSKYYTIIQDFIYK